MKINDIKVNQLKGRALYILKFYVLIFSFCSPEKNLPESQDQLSQHDTISEDSVKIIFYNFNRKMYDSMYAAAKEMLKDKNLNVDKLLEKVSGKDSMNYEYYAQYSYMLNARGRSREALRYIGIGEKLSKDKSRVYFDKAIAWAYLQKLHDRDTVYNYLNLAIKYDSLNPYYWIARSQFHNEDGLYQNAIEDVNRALQLAPNDTDYVNLRAWYKLSTRDYEGTLEDLKVLSANSKDNAFIYMYRAISYNKLKKYKDALREANKCLTLDPTIAVVYSTRGNAKYNLGDKEGGDEDIRKGAELGDREAMEFIKKYDENNRKTKEL